MKIKEKTISYQEAMRLKKEHKNRPQKPSLLMRRVMKLAAQKDLKDTNFSYEMIGMEKLPKGQPCLILMNHSSFIDLEIAQTLFADRALQIVCTSDGFVGKQKLMSSLGCIPTNKFVPDARLIKDMNYALKKLQTSVLMYPEASYSFDGTATPLPESLGKCIKILQVPVVLVMTEGAFHRDPLYNNLQKRQVDVSAKVTYFLSPEEIKAKSPEQINEQLKKAFSFDQFRWQQENEIIVAEDFRADFLNRVLYKCPACGSEGHTRGQGTDLSCMSCGKTYELTEQGYMKALSGETEFPHIPDWYAWERQCVKRDLEEKSYKLEVPVVVRVLVNLECLYTVGEGILTHTEEGFHLTGCDGQIDYYQKPTASYSLYADYFWYELGDMICIGNHEILYYCFPKTDCDVVAKTRLAAEELYKMKHISV